MVYLNTLLLCCVFALLAYYGTGSDKKNVRNYRTLDPKIQERIMKNPELAPLVKIRPAWQTWTSNLITFLVLFFILGLDMKTESYGMNVLYLSVMGQVFNVFDLVVIDMLWFRNSKRVRLSGTEDLAKYYQASGPHVKAFLRAIPMFIVVALLDGWLLTLIA